MQDICENYILTESQQYFHQNLYLDPTIQVLKRVTEYVLMIRLYHSEAMRFNKGIYIRAESI